MPGTVYLVGAGPGDPTLVTVKGQALIRRAHVVVYDHLASPRLLSEASPRARLVYVGKEAEKPSSTQRAINALLIREARAGKTIVRLKGGDPLLFGRGAEEALALKRARIAYEIVPGVSSAIGVPAYAGIPLTHRGLSSSVAIVTGHEDPSKPGGPVAWPQLAKTCDTVVCLMGVRTLAAIIERVLGAGRDRRTPCAIIERGTWPQQRTIVGTLGTIVKQAKAARVTPPAILVIGEVVRLRESLKWFEDKPLFGKRILVTRASERAGELVSRLEALGAEVVQLPAIELAPVRQNGLLRQALRDIAETDWVFFTSPEGLGWFVKMLKPYRKDVRLLAGCRIAAIGPRTAAAIEAAGLHVDFVPKQFRQEGVLEALPARLLRGKRALLLNAQGSRDVLERGLRARGMRVNRVPVYRTIVPSTLRAGVRVALRQRCDYVTVTSGSCVEHLLRALQAAGQAGTFATLPFASIGPVTSRSVRERGGRVAVEASHATVEGLIDALCRKARKR